MKPVTFVVNKLAGRIRVVRSVLASSSIIKLNQQLKGGYKKE